MDAMSIDMDPAASPANTATSVGTLESCARVNENNLMDADEDSVDTLNVDITATNIPAGNPIAAFQYYFEYSEANLTVQSAAHNFLLEAGGGSVPINLSDTVPDTNANDFWLAAVADLGTTYESGSGVLSRIQLSSDSGATPGVYSLTLRPDSSEDAGDGSAHWDSLNNPQSPDALNDATVAVDTGCPPAGPYTVDTISNALLNACTGAPLDCSLRGAISNAAALGSADTITFDTGVFPPGTPATITLGSALPTLSNNGDTIDATGAGVIVDGVTNSFDCLTVSGSGNTIVGLREITGCATAIRISGASNTIGGSNASELGGQCSNATDDDSDDFINDGCAAVAAPETGIECSNGIDDDADTVVNDGCPPRGQGVQIDGNSQEGILITGEAADGNTIKGNWIGVNSSLSAASANNTGIRIDGGADANLIGGTTVGERNLVSGNSGYGVLIRDTGTSGNTVAGNYIGTDAEGAVAVANGFDGVRIEGSATGNTVGGSAAGALNVLSGNAAWGVTIDASGTTGNVVKGNYVGTTAAGNSALPNFGGVKIAVASGNTVGGSTAADRNVISGNTRYGVAITGNPSSGNVVKGNYIGTDTTGTADLGNLWDGITISADALTNTIGGTTSGDRNVISGNDRAGVLITGTSVTGNTVLGNYIGTNAAGTAAVPNTQEGVRIEGGSDGNTIGGSTSGHRNVISGNSGDGVEINGAGSNGNFVIGNYIGTDATGANDVGNSGSAVYICGGNSNEIGGTLAGAGNVISGNNNGIAIDAACGTPTGNLIRGNYIGVNASGTGGLGNDNYGLLLAGDSGTVVGGASAGARNVISGNINSGILASASSSGAIIRGNYIGTNAAATGPIPNSQHGIDIQGSASSVTIGGVGAGEGNTIAYNAFVGVRVASGTGHSVRGNSTHSNGSLGIDLAPDGVTANDAGDGDSGPNNLQNFPVITSVVVGSTTISGTLDTPSPETAFVDVYASDVADGSGNGEGRAFLGTAVPDTFGAWSLTIPGVPPYAIITATATKGGSTSEFSASFTMSGSPEAGLPSTAIAYKGQASPIGSTYNFFGPGQVPNTTGEVVFWSALLSGTQGIFDWVSPGPATKQVATGDAAPGGGTFTDLTDCACRECFRRCCLLGGHERANAGHLPARIRRRRDEARWPGRRRARRQHVLQLRSACRQADRRHQQPGRRLVLGCAGQRRPGRLPAQGRRHAP